MEKTQVLPLVAEGGDRYHPKRPIAKNSLSEASRDLWYFDDSEIDILVDRLSRLEPTDFHRLASDLHKALRQAIAAGAPTAEGHYLGAALAPTVSAPLPETEPSQVQAMTPPVSRTPVSAPIALHRTSEGVVKYRRRRGLRIAFPLAAAVVTLAVPWRFPVFQESPPLKAVSLAPQPTVSSEQRPSADHGPPRSGPSRSNK